MTTRRERLEHKADRLRGWAAKRENAAEAMLKVDETIRHDWAFITQPGHIPARDRMNKRDDRAFASLSKADEMTGRAAGIEHALDHSIYSDDDDAVGRLEERIAGLEAEQTTIKAFNKAWRAKDADRHALIEALEEPMRSGFRSSLRVEAYNCKSGFPAYRLSNLSADIRRNRERLEGLKREAAPDYVEPPRFLYALKYAGDCRSCGRHLEQGANALYFRKAQEVACYPACPGKVGA